MKKILIIFLLLTGVIFHTQLFSYSGEKIGDIKCNEIIESNRYRSLSPIVIEKIDLIGDRINNKFITKDNLYKEKIYNLYIKVLNSHLQKTKYSELQKEVLLRIGDYFVCKKEGLINKENLEVFNIKVIDITNHSAKVIWEGNSEAQTWLYVKKKGTTGNKHDATDNSYNYPNLGSGYDFTLFIQGKGSNIIKQVDFKTLDKINNTDEVETNTDEEEDITDQNNIDYSNISDIEERIYKKAGLIHDQIFVVPEIMKKGDYIGTLNKQWIIYRNIKVKYSIIENYNNLFAIKDNGTIYITKDENLPSKFSIKIRADDTQSSEYSIAVINVKSTKENKTIYIDPSGDYDCGTRNGTRNCPYSSWKKISNNKKAGYAYLQKRGSVSYSHIDILTNATKDNPTIIGAYGSGKRPVFDGKNDNPDKDGDAGIAISGWNSGDCNNLEIYSLIVQNYPIHGILTGRYYSNITLRDIKTINNGHRSRSRGNPGVYIYGNRDKKKNANVLVEDLWTEGNGEHGFKSGTNLGITVKNSFSQINGGNGFSFPESGDVDISNCIATLNDSSGFKLHTYGGTIVDNCIADKNYNQGFQIANYYGGIDGAPNNSRFGIDVHIKDSLAYDNIGPGLAISDDAKGSVIDGFEAYHNGNGIEIIHNNYKTFSFYPNENHIIKNSLLHDNFNSGIKIGRHSWVVSIGPIKNIQILNNKIYNNGYVDKNKTIKRTNGEVGFKAYKTYREFDSYIRSDGNWRHSRNRIYYANDYIEKDNIYYSKVDGEIEVEYVDGVIIKDNIIYNNVNSYQKILKKGDKLYNLIYKK